MEARQVSSKLNVSVLRVEPLAAPLLRTRGSCLILLQCHQVRSPSRSKRSCTPWATLNDKLSGVLISSFTLPLEVSAAKAGMPETPRGEIAAAHKSLRNRARRPSLLQSHNTWPSLASPKTLSCWALAAGLAHSVQLLSRGAGLVAFLVGPGFTVYV